MTRVAEIAVQKAFAEHVATRIELPVDIIGGTVESRHFTHPLAHSQPRWRLPAEQSTRAPSGSIVAAATGGLPEQIGGAGSPERRPQLPFGAEELTAECAFSIVLNVHSAETPTGHREAILSTAIDLIAQKGVASVTVRQVAGSLDVSPPLILHHFGSRQGLIDACDHHVRATLQHVLDRLEFEQLEASMQALLADPELGSALDYVARSLCDRGPVGQWWLDEVLDLSIQAHHRMVADGAVRAVGDDEMTVTLMLTMELGMFMLRPLLEARLGASLTSPEVLDRWAHAEIDLLANGYLASGSPDRDQERTVAGDAPNPDDPSTTGSEP